jgi:hypothetical protein
MQLSCNGCDMILPRIHYLNPSIHDDYKLIYYQLTESQIQNNFMVIILYPFSCVPYIKDGCYITWIFLEIINPLKALAMPCLVCVTLNEQHQFKEFLKTQIWVRFCNLFVFLLLWLSLSTYWYAMTSWKLKFKHVDWNNRQVLKPLKVICLINWLKIKILSYRGNQGSQEWGWKSAWEPKGLESVGGSLGSKCKSESTWNPRSWEWGWEFAWGSKCPGIVGGIPCKNPRSQKWGWEFTWGSKGSLEWGQGSTWGQSNNLG